MPQVGMCFMSCRNKMMDVGPKEGEELEGRNMIRAEALLMCDLLMQSKGSHCCKLDAIRMGDETPWGGLSRDVI